MGLFFITDEDDIGQEFNTDTLVPMTDPAITAVKNVLHDAVGEDMDAIEGDWRERRNVEYQCFESYSIDELPADLFNKAYVLLMDACQKQDVLKPYAGNLKAIMQKDPRYKAVEPA